ncbi:hypothetical protein N7481_011015 [Penicillium waksmanii]|uniref:uncharacterized protein n=1 Tax=Penicillium waksmanii TaxID=69791 RepID=UPI0025482CB1|nr:uncharacterized protein N7481_011015 [Penicillium waksmanii]KAJ5973805.1 hypothetical protein N7481_011015 [Penicillium waksmanii]
MATLKLAAGYAIDASPIAAPSHSPFVAASVSPLSSSSTTVSVKLDQQAPFKAIKALFDHLKANPEDATKLSGTYSDYGTFSIIFQDGVSGLELEEAPGVWVPAPGDANVILTGWCVVVLSGGRISAAKHRVRRMPGPMDTRSPTRDFSDTIVRGNMTVETFKEVMGKRWGYREGNEVMAYGDAASQDSDIERLIWAYMSGGRGVSSASGYGR